ncbi:MAG: NADH:flavin oxidoreductase [Promethearchaeota archaeon]|nr:MAG: NADH:flavin oxidoreductase [Candidatus Lokiarchaeota archaeon]
MIKIELKYLFHPGKIRNVQIKNRIVRSGTYERRATKDGYVTDRLIKLYTDLAQGGTGLIITGAIAIDPKSSGSPDQTNLYDDSFIPRQRKLVKAVHDYSDVRIAPQLVHIGRQLIDPRYPPVGPSPILNKYTKLIPRELTVEEIRAIIERFVDAGRRAYEIGYDMVQVHAAHGYLLSDFISPFANKRNDEYGGDTQKRTKILVDIYNQLRDEIGKNFPIIIKLQTQDFISGGLTVNDAKEITKILVDVGYDAIEPSGGGGESMLHSMKELKKAYPSNVIKTPEDENYFLSTAKELKPLMNNCQLILVGGIKNPLSAEKILQENHADFISMCRPLLYEPALPNRWKSGDLSPALCKSCNSCFSTMMRGEVFCVVKKRIEKRKLRKNKDMLKK